MRSCAVIIRMCTIFASGCVYIYIYTNGDSIRHTDHSFVHLWNSSECTRYASMVIGLRYCSERMWRTSCYAIPMKFIVNTQCQCIYKIQRWRKRWRAVWGGAAKSARETFCSLKIRIGMSGCVAFPSYCSMLLFNFCSIYVAIWRLHFIYYPMQTYTHRIIYYIKNIKNSFITTLLY